MFNDPHLEWACTEPARIDPYLGQHFEVGYDGGIPSSLGIVDAGGIYGYNGLTSLYFVIMDTWAEPIGMIFDSMTNMVPPVPTRDPSWGEIKASYR